MFPPLNKMLASAFLREILDVVKIGWQERKKSKILVRS